MTLPHLPIPSFLRPAGLLNGPPPEPSSLDPKTTEIIDSIQATIRERDSLRRDVDRLTTISAHDTDRIRFLQDEILRIANDRDFYLRHSTALKTRLKDICLLIGQVQDEAELEAYQPKPVPCNATPDDGAAAIASKLAPSPQDEGTKT